MSIYPAVWFLVLCIAAALTVAPVAAKPRAHHGGLARRVAAHAHQGTASPAPSDSGTVVYDTDGQVLGADPDPRIRFELLRGRGGNKGGGSM